MRHTNKRSSSFDSAQRQFRLTAAMGAIAAASLIGSGAHAQTAGDPAPVDENQDAPLQENQGAEIIVTGSRVSGFTSPTPLTTIGEEELQTRAVRNLADIMFDTPTLKPTQNTGQSSQPIGASNFDLRGLGPNRTLVLVDGRRFPATDPTGGVDVNVIPAALVKRIEIVTGGASAAYGSDAVSGVVNILLDDRMEGVRGSVQYGQSTYDDHYKPAVSLAVGKAFGNFHFVASGDYFRDSGQLAQESRPWARGDYAVLTNPAYPGTPGAPRLVIAPNARFSQMTTGGVTLLNSIPALQNIQFGPNGTVLPFNRGTLVGSTYMSGGDGGTLSATSNISPVIERATGFGRLSYDVSDSVTLYADALYSRADIFSDGTTATDRNLVIQRDNAFLPEPIRDILIANNRTSFSIGRIGAEEGAFTNTVDNTVQRYGLGANGEFGNGWHWDVSAQFSRVRYYREDGNNRNNARYSLGVDSVINPATNRPICRALLNNPNPTDAQDPYRDIRDCVPIDVFGPGSMSQAALDYIGGTAFLDSRQEQDIYAVNLEGSPFSTWAGDVSIAVGAEYRRESVRATNDAVSQRSGWKTVNPQALDGSLNVKEAYAEIVVPLLRDSGLGRLLDLNLAGRVTDYSTSGTVTTWKAGVNYQPIDSIRLRATLSKDIRAANINELYSGQNQFINTITNPVTNVALSTLQLTGGNPDLHPEESRAFTAGIVFEPGWLPGFRVSFDYFSFKIDEAITSLTGQQIVDGCLAQGQTALCNAITFNGNTITQVQATLINAAQSTAKGFDIEAVYGFDLGAGRVSIRGLATHVSELTVTSDGVTTDFAGTVGSTGTMGPAGGIPKWRGTLSVDYGSEAFGVGALVRYVDGGKLNVSYVEGVDIADNSVPSRTYVDLNGRVRLTGAIEIYGTIDNLLNTAPPLTPNAITAPSYASSVFYDRIGRTYTIGARFRF
ncbi:TonB-dependent receptor domain-containing protein [Sphingosinithalassobacter portus]|uniref:TonB-dependent receptor domain-containing protein n=1 Tax=Stakelama portus TaxID=2676234 RepID=UPI000D6DFE37|nr:TonB-dependent receptor [Sphingosinithalassobacter portus]